VLQTELEKVKSSTYQKQLDNELLQTKESVQQQDSYINQVLEENKQQVMCLEKLQQELKETLQEQNDLILEAEAKERAKFIRLHQSYETLENLYSISQLSIQDLENHNSTLQEQILLIEGQGDIFQEKGLSSTSVRHTKLEADIKRRQNDLQKAKVLIGEEHDKIQELQAIIGNKLQHGGTVESGNPVIEKMETPVDHLLKRLCHKTQLQQVPMKKTPEYTDRSNKIDQNFHIHKGIQCTAAIEQYTQHTQTQNPRQKNNEENPMQITQGIQCTLLKSERKQTSCTNILSKNASIQVDRQTGSSKEKNASFTSDFKKLHGGALDENREHREAFAAASKKLNTLHHLITRVKNDRL
jgi:hypothetical protein